jgi:hypothetical protein
VHYIIFYAIIRIIFGGGWMVENIFKKNIMGIYKNIFAIVNNIFFFENLKKITLQPSTPPPFRI